MDIKKVIIPAAGLGTRFLPLSKIVSKEIWPLVDKPLFQYVVEEAVNSGADEIIFVLSPREKRILEYLKPSKEIENILKKRKKEKLLTEFKEFEKLIDGVSFNYVIQKKPLGDGQAILQAEKLVKDEFVGCLFVDDIVYSKTPCLLQLFNVFKTCQKPVISLYRLAREKLSSYGIVEVEKIANRLFKVKEIIEKPAVEEAPSDFSIVGKYVLTPEVFEYLKKTRANEKGEIILAEAFNKMLQDGKTLYGYEFEGKWLECGNKLDWLKSHIYLSLHHPLFGQELKKFLKEIKYN